MIPQLIVSLIGGPVVTSLIKGYRASLDARNMSERIAADLAIKDETRRGGWVIQNFPEPMNEWQGAILLSFFGIYTLGKAMQTDGAAIAMRKR